MPIALFPFPSPSPSPNPPSPRFPFREALRASISGTTLALLAACGSGGGDGDGPIGGDVIDRLEEQFRPSDSKACGPQGSYVSTFIPERWYGLCGTDRVNVSFSEACVAHDRCYDTAGADRDECDRGFRALLDEECGRRFEDSSCSRSLVACKAVAGEYYVKVRAGGEEPFRRAQEAARATPTPAPSPTPASR